MVDRGFRKIGLAALPRMLEQLKLPLELSWHRAHTIETSVFFDTFEDPALWTPGPNTKAQCNRIEVGKGQWLWLSAGTDWQLFQGAFREVSAEPLEADWLSFRVCIAEPAFTGAFVALAPGLHNWGLAPPAFIFAYHGDERAKSKRCFVVQGHSPCTTLVLQRDVEAKKVYEIAVQFNWRAALISVWVDGVRQVSAEPFNAVVGIRIVALYNWRSQACAAFSMLCLGTTVPPLVPPAVRVEPPPAPLLPRALRMQHSWLASCYSTCTLVPLWALAMVIGLAALAIPHLWQ